MRTVLRAPCPVCREEIEYIYQTEEIPYFSEILIESANCPCGWRMSDAFIMREGVPGRDELTVSGEEDLSVRVVRGSAGTIEVPELGIEIKPGPAAEAFISNVEGVLDRIDAVLEIALRTAGAEERERCLAIRDRIAAVKRGEDRVTLIIEDPTGNSALIRNPEDGCE
ncbi:ZPR1 zinc finger domain-containing protein [Methanofollis formosanus]|uniref:ZPR1 zinc finger domain-containing protein n=1 Tax=Methanofollis formosanus TaxID=299308 RepID=A0A8G1A347_9EURY|nr:ZPR1 zinc finger domain-containing protein [Methanofollis formosanus]QYZ79563.1 ZPR1 zinc finger domain-containing protein [Methanofollis formosanus]